MFDISPVCQANLALWHAITGLITAVCGLEGTQAGLAALTGPDRLIRSAGTQNSNSQTPHISLLAHNSLQVQKSIVLYTCSLTPFFCFLVLTSDALTRCHPSFCFWLALGCCDISTKTRCCQPFTIFAQHHGESNHLFVFVLSSRTPTL